AESRLRRQVDMAQSLYTQLRLQQEQAATQAVRNTPALSVIDPPLLPAQPSKPKRRLVVLGGLVTGLSIGLLRLMSEKTKATKPLFSTSAAA
ncbi:MAG: GNVR domain-containing protein, partial [bacterium]